MSAEARRWIGQAVEDLAAARRIAADPDLPPRLVALQAALPEDDAASLTEIRLLFVGSAGMPRRYRSPSSVRGMDQGGRPVSDWHSWDEVRQVDVAERMGVSKARVSHIEHGAVATIELLARYLDAIGGRLEITAAFDGGAERVVLDWPAA